MPDANHILGEVEPTFWRLTKIFWSLFWRAVILITIVVALLALLAHFIKQDHEYSELMPNIIDAYSNPKLVPIYLVWLVALYGFECLVFRLIIGNKYKDFTLTFVPHLDYKDSNYWPTIRAVAWANYWRGTLIFTFFDVSEYMAHLSQSPYSYGVIILQILASILILNYVVNKHYGAVRFSLLELK
jgi:hypothetical protein